LTNLEAVRARFALNAGLPFADVLTEANIRDVLNDHGVGFRDRLFNPITTIWGFLSQVLSDDHSCRDAVSRVIAHRVTQGVEPCSPNTASYCNARLRLPADVLRTLTRRTAQELQSGVPGEWKWHGRSVFIVDGSHVSMPDTAENQATYPQTPTPKPGVGFPLARITVSLSLATGACHDLAIAPYAGKGTGETTLMRKMYDSLRPGDVVLADALFDNYYLICELRDRGIDIVARVKYERANSDIIGGGPGGETLVWKRPQPARGMTAEQHRAYPERLTMRRVHVDARDRDNRAERFDVITTILDAAITGEQIGDIYERRWCGEVDLRSIKSTMQMRILRGKTPAMVEKEIWAHLLAYNLLRTAMALAAREHDLDPRHVSFKGAKQVVTAFAPKLEAAPAERRAALFGVLLTTVAYYRVGNRPGRWEPRARKRRPERGDRLMQPRAVARLPRNRSRWY
jgi:hypothetical protein